MNTPISWSKFAPGTYKSICHLDLLRMPLPFRAFSRNFSGGDISVPPELDNICWGKNINIRSDGDFAVGDYNIRTNGTKLLYGELGKPYRPRAKDQNYLDSEDFPLIRKLLRIPDDCEIPDQLYRTQLAILVFKKFKALESLLNINTFHFQWRYGRNKINRLEISIDFLAPLDPDELIAHLDRVISMGEGEPRTRTDQRHKRYSRERPHRKWDILPNHPVLRRAKCHLKAYQKDCVGRLELVVEKLPIADMPSGKHPVGWLYEELIRTTDAMAKYLNDIECRLREVEPRINDLARATLAEGLLLYSPYLKIAKRKDVQVFIEMLISRNAYSPNTHAGIELGRKIITKLADLEFGICILEYNDDKSRRLVLRADWREQLDKLKASKIPKAQRRPLSSPSHSECPSELGKEHSRHISPRYTRRDVFQLKPVIHFFQSILFGLRKPTLGSRDGG